MYHITIKTKYNVIEIDVDNYNTPEVQEIFEQPYVLEISIDKIDESKVKKKLKTKE